MVVSVLSPMRGRAQYFRGEREKRKRDFSSGDHLNINRTIGVRKQASVLMLAECLHQPLPGFAHPVMIG